MNEVTTTKAEARDAEEVLQDENATPTELVETTMGNTDDTHTTVAGPSFDEEFGVNPRNVEIGTVITLAVSLVLALVIFFALVMKKKAPRSSFMRWLREFLNFRRVWIANILKFVYIFSAIALTIGSIVMMFLIRDKEGFLIFVFLGMIVFGNIALRLGFELFMITIGLWENTRDIRRVLVKEEEAPEERAPKKEKKAVEIAVEDEDDD